MIQKLPHIRRYYFLSICIKMVRTIFSSLLGDNFRKNSKIRQTASFGLKKSFEEPLWRTTLLYRDHKVKYQDVGIQPVVLALFRIYLKLYLN